MSAPRGWFWTAQNPPKVLALFATATKALSVDFGLDGPLAACAERPTGDRTYLRIELHCSDCGYYKHANRCMPSVACRIVYSRRMLHRGLLPRAVMFYNWSRTRSLAGRGCPLAYCEYSLQRAVLPHESPYSPLMVAQPVTVPLSVAERPSLLRSIAVGAHTPRVEA